MRKKTIKKPISLLLFLFIAIISLCSELIANDKPLLIRYDQNWYFPILNDYPETTFGGIFETSTIYKDPYIEKKIKSNGFMIWPLIRFSYDTINFSSSMPFPAPPSTENWLGTDSEGRDVVARLLYGFRISLLFGLALTVFSSVIGIIAGAVQGYYGGLVDLLGQRFIEIWSGIPSLFLIILLASVVEPNFWWLLLITVLFGWMTLVGLVRAEFLRARNFEYVKAAKCLGVSDSKIILHHILPNALVATLTYMPFILSGSIMTLTSLDFLGFGLPENYPSLGELLLQGKNNLQAPWLGLTSFVFLSLVLSLLVFIGEFFRTRFDPHR